jgi:hypothetical protein
MLFFTLFLSSRLSAQTIIQLIKAGDEKFEIADYYAASLYYKDALKKNENDPELNYKFAEASRLFNDYTAAADAYQRVAASDHASQYPLALFWYGEMLRSSCVCKTEEALKQLKRFKNRYHAKDYYAAKAQQEIEACSWVLDHKKINDSVVIEHLGKDVNTTNSEFNAMYIAPDKIQYSSLRNISDDKKKENYRVRIYNQQPNPEKIYMPEGADPSLNIGNGVYAPGSKQFYFTQCEQKDKASTRCDIYVSKYENYKWLPAEKLSINNPNATSTQPGIGFDTHGNEVLFFASDRPGGEGGLDLWASTVGADGSYGAPVNLGKPVNTPGNEITPFYDINSKRLFFSSDWHYGFGGYDIFETSTTGQGWRTPENLLQPVNSSQNDLYYSIAFDNSKAFITSNRVGSYFIEAETCCNDIYAYNTGKKIEKRADTITIAKKDTVNSGLTVGTPTNARDAIPPLVPTNHQPEAPKTIAQKLKRIQKYVPLALYFHNDEPDCCNLRDTTALDYKQTYEAYEGLRFEYERNFSKGLKGHGKDAAKGEIDSLFTNKVDKGFYNLVAFSAELLDLLQSGASMEVTIKGYCSPLNYSEYNIKLGYRRVASLKNFFYHYREGIFLPFIAGGKLALKSVSFGKETAPKTVSENRLDTRNSVYNPAAALERRVEIISVETK